MKRFKPIFHVENTTTKQPIKPQFHFTFLKGWWRKSAKNKLNLSRIEEALSSILNYVETQNSETTKTESSKFLNQPLLRKKVGPVAQLG